MSHCWYCFHGWSKAVMDIYIKHAEIAGESAMLYGPAHVVWEDENFDVGCIELCIRDCDAPWSTVQAKWPELLKRELDAVRASLVELLALPEHIRECQPDGYDGNNPELFPPTVPMAGGRP